MLKKKWLYAESPKFWEAESCDKWLKISQILEWETHLRRDLRLIQNPKQINQRSKLKF